MLLAPLLSAFTTVVQYWLGSNAGSKAKDATLKALTDGNTRRKYHARYSKVHDNYSYIILIYYVFGLSGRTS
jgi:hypothetical protein